MSGTKRKKEPSIRLSPKYGLNPSIPVCFLCGEDKNEIILPGRLRDDAEAPRKCVWNYEPCDKCKEYMKQGIILISAKSGGDTKNPDRTGGWVVVKEEAVKRIFTNVSIQEEVLKKRTCFVEDEAWDQIGLPRGEVKETHENVT